MSSSDFLFYFFLNHVCAQTTQHLFLKHVLNNIGLLCTNPYYKRNSSARQKVGIF